MVDRGGAGTVCPGQAGLNTVGLGRATTRSMLTVMPLASTMAVTLRLVPWCGGVSHRSTVGGVAFALLVVAVGDCSAFGGRCPVEPEPRLRKSVRLR